MRVGKAAWGAMVVVGAATSCAAVFDLDALGPPAGEPEPEAGLDARGDGSSPAGDGGPGEDAARFRRGPTGLDEGLALPGLDGATCGAVDEHGACGEGGASACRMATPDSGRCVTCPEGRCLGGVGAPCRRADDCWLDLECFRARCALTCPLGGDACGPTRECLDVGFFGLGVCSATGR